MKRRQLAGVAIAGVAGLAGMGAALWRYRTEPVAADASGQLWTTGFTGLDGQALTLAAWRGRPWATC